MNLDAVKSSIKKYPIGAGAAIIVVLALGGFYIRHIKMAEVREVYDSAAAQGRRYVANTTYAGQLDEQLLVLQETNKTISSRLVNPQDLAINLQYFYKLEAETGVKLLDTHPAAAQGASKTAVKGVYTPVQYVVSLQGGYAQTLAFLRRLEHGVFFCRVISGNCGQAQSEQEKGASDTVMSLTVELLGRS